MFDVLREGKFEGILRIGVLVPVIPFLIAGAVASHRAYFQLRRLEVRIESADLHAGSEVQAEAVSSGRVPVTLSLQIIQGRQVCVLDSRIVPASRDAFFDPRTVQGGLSVRVTPEMLASFTEGPAVVRATLRGRPQWMREPPPLVREIGVRLNRN